MSKENFKNDLKYNVSNETKNLQAFDTNFVPEYDENGNLVNHPILDIFSDYLNVRNNDFTIEYFKMVVSAIFLEYRRLYPGLDIIIQFREKGESYAFKIEIDSLCTITQGFSSRTHPLLFFQYFYRKYCR